MEKRLSKILGNLGHPAYPILLTKDAKDRIWRLHKHIKPSHKKKRRKTQIAYGKVETKQKPPPKPEAMNLGAQATGQIQILRHQYHIQQTRTYPPISC